MSTKRIALFADVWSARLSAESYLPEVVQGELSQRGFEVINPFPDRPTDPKRAVAYVANSLSSCSTVVCLEQISLGHGKTWWLGFAKQLGKPILGIVTLGGNKQLLEAFDKLSIPAVEWQAEHVAGILSGEIDPWWAEGWQLRRMSTAGWRGRP